MTMHSFIPGFHLSREKIFQGWVEGESSKVVGVIEDEFKLHKEDPRVKELRKWIVQYQTNEAQEPYFYSVRKICPADIARDRKIKQLPYVFIACITVSLVVFFVARSYFSDQWKMCPIALSSMFPLIGTVWFFQPAGRRGDHLIVERSKDERVPPPNFDINNDYEPLTQEMISKEKLRSPQMIYLSNYVCDAKGFVRSVFINGDKNFSDPVYRTPFTEQERKEVLLQIEKIFLIQEKEFNKCFESVSKRNDTRHYRNDKRVFDENGRFSDNALDSLLRTYAQQDLDANLAQAQNKEDWRALGVALLESTGYIESLKNDDCASSRIRLFEDETGVSLGGV